MKELHKKTMLEVQSLLDETGHRLSLSDIADVVELDELAHRVTGPGGDYDDVFSWPVHCAGLLLKPLSLAKIAWYNRCAVKWFDDDSVTTSTILAFLASCENDEAILDKLTTPEQARDTIEAWERTVTATPMQIAAAVEKLLGGRDGGEEKDGPSSFGPLVSLLCREYGESPEHWMYRASLPVIEALMGDYTTRINEQIKRHGKSAGKGSGVAPVQTPSMQATLKFRKKLLALRERWGAGQ